MNKEELIRNLKYTEKKHRNDTVDTFDTDISMMCSDVLRVLENCIEIPEGATNGDMIKALFPDIESRLDEKTGIVLVKWVDGTTKTFKASWWNAPYQKEVEE